MNRTRSRIVAVAAGALLLLAGCGDTTGGTAVVNSTVEATTGAPTSASASSDTSSSDATSTRTSSRTTESSSSSETPESSELEPTDESTDDSVTTPDGPTDESSSGSDPGGSTTPPAELDPTTEAWFQTFCDGTTDVAQYAGPDTAGQTLPEAQATIVQAYSDLSAASAQAAVTLQTTTPPAIPGGDQYNQTSIALFQSLADVYSRGSQEIAGLSVTDEAQLRDAIDAIEGDARAAQEGVGGAGLPALPDGVAEAVAQLPACQGVF
jgi:hypothetical protein